MVDKISPQKAREVKIIDYDLSLLSNKELIQSMRLDILDGDGYVIKNFVNPSKLDQIKTYLMGVGQNSLPSYHHLQEGCPDFHRVQQLDQRSYVKGIMHQFMFHPWNQNVFDMFTLMKPVYNLKNLLSGLEQDSFLETTPKDGFISRLSYQFYPQGGGCIKRHADPVDEHQLCVPILMMSDFGTDYKNGGGYVVGDEGEVINTDSYMNKGDVLFCNAQVAHGVADIDPDSDMDWLSFKGRWICLVSVIKTLANTTTANSLQLED